MDEKVFMPPKTVLLNGHVENDEFCSTNVTLTPTRRKYRAAVAPPNPAPITTTPPAA
jgi:hypothetical protein